MLLLNPDRLFWPIRLRRITTPSPYIRRTDYHFLIEEYHKTGGPVVTHFPYFLFFPNGERFFYRVGRGRQLRLRRTCSTPTHLSPWAGSTRATGTWAGGPSRPSRRARSGRQRRGERKKPSRRFYCRVIQSNRVHQQSPSRPF